MNHRSVLRRCVSCRKVFNREKLFKVTNDYKDGVVVDGGMGRSAYICTNKTCLEEAWRRKRLQKSLRTQVNLNVIEVLKNRLNYCNDSVAEAR